MQAADPAGKSNARVLTLLFPFAALFIYILLRAYRVSFTHDEAYTVLDFGDKPLWYINKIGYTNNHLLNTWCVHFLLRCGFTGAFVLRLPNVIGGFIFLFYLARLTSRLFHGTGKAAAAFVFISCNAFVIDFFGLCRGYGISFGLLMAALWFSYRYLATGKHLLYGILSVALTVLATLANYTLLNLLLLQVFFFFTHSGYHLFIGRKAPGAGKRAGVYLAFLGGVIVFVSWFLRMMFALKAEGNFDFGGADGFWKDTIGSLVEADCFLLYDLWNPMKWVILFTALSVYLLIVVLEVRSLLEKESGITVQFSRLLFLLTSGCGMAIIAQHYLLHIPYATDRTALHLVVLFSLLVVTRLFAEGKKKRWKRAAAVIFFLLTTSSFLLSLNLSRTIIWPLNAGAAAAVTSIADDSREWRAAGNDVTVGVTFSQYPVYNYYIWSRQLKGLALVNAEATGFLPSCDYCLLWEYDPDPPADAYTYFGKQKELAVFRHRKPFVQFDTLRRFDLGFEESLPKYRAPGHTGRYSQLVGCDHTGCDGMNEIVSDTIPAGSRISIRVWTYASAPFNRAEFICSATRNNEAVLWKRCRAAAAPAVPLQWEEWETTFTVSTTVVPGDRVIAYLVNEDRVPLRVDDLRVSVLKPQQ